MEEDTGLCLCTEGRIQERKGDMHTKNTKNRLHLDWMKPDNTANFCSMVTTRKFAHIFRLSVELKEEIDPVILNEALQVVLKRIPGFALKLRYGLFWNYLEMTDDMAEVEKDVRNPMFRENWKLNKHFLFRVRYFGKRISLEVFHAIADGTGGMKFLITLVAEYLRRKHGYEIEESEWILHPDHEPVREEYEDSYSRVARRQKFIRKNPKAYRAKGTNEPNGYLNIITGHIPVDAVKTEAKKYQCTVTAFLMAVLMDAFQDIQEREKKASRRNLPIVITVPVDLRKFYPSQTVNNFFANANIGLDRTMGHYSFEEIVTQAKHGMALNITEKRLNNLIAGNIASYQKKAYKIIPMIIKKPFVILGNYVAAEKKSTCTLSNLGNVVLPPNMSEYVSKIHAVAGRNFGRVTSCMSVSYQGMMFVTFTRKIKEAEIERLFYTKLVEMGIPVEIESNQNLSEDE